MIRCPQLKCLILSGWVRFLYYPNVEPAETIFKRRSKRTGLVLGFGMHHLGLPVLMLCLPLSPTLPDSIVASQRPRVRPAGSRAQRRRGLPVDPVSGARPRAVRHDWRVGDDCSGGCRRGGYSGARRLTDLGLFVVVRWVFFPPGVFYVS